MCGKIAVVAMLSSYPQFNSRDAVVQLDIKRMYPIDMNIAKFEGPYVYQAKAWTNDEGKKRRRDVPLATPREALEESFFYVDELPKSVITVEVSNEHSKDGDHSAIASAIVPMKLIDQLDTEVVVTGELKWKDEVRYKTTTP